MDLSAKALGSYQGSLNPEKHKKAIEAHLQKGADKALILFKISTGTWQSGGGFEINKKDTYTKEIATSEKPYIFINWGTTVRYAQLSPDWKSKSQPGQLPSGPGAGRVLFIDKSRPKPGIKPRRFDKLVADRIRSWLAHNPIKFS